ncbi:MAG: TlpA family protein disulfide reductase [Myxococcales bacterium]|nr:TlpA family protein disulfide reductase [Myxococcales bacterium]
MIRAVAAALTLCLGATACGPAAMAPPPTPGPRGPTLAVVEAALDLDGAVVGPPAAAEVATVAIVFASWCVHCREEMPVLAELHARRPDVRILGINYRAHEEYDGRGDAVAVRQFVAERAPWLRVVPADERVWRSVGRPPKVPTVLVFDRAGALVRAFDRRSEAVPDLAALEAVVPTP